MAHWSLPGAGGVRYAFLQTLLLFTCDTKQVPSDKKSIHKSNYGKTTHLIPKQAKILLVKSRHEPCTNITDEILMESLNSKKKPVDNGGINSMEK